ncbi:LacI family DNA-binding transcriptional regulator [Pelagicoccus sp. SDUM812005]|uniref:LacI family DNA-binding transcriptional regulator n=1 Tax=Pelagicoccus sp. SDUM812005 TaxID=3041257 RepID=UPI0028101DC8|nr:LacI family DNA-binding transcriptional regulator [Pelagicoccus sp. SDUM812005]MDQ8180256.1 LacI family DNA-binding transcriptional regulator [Pelagicoccus sp. SDUM812005]
MATRITLKDIAAKCGCTVATVSRALRNRTEIPETTRKRIQEVAKQIGYVPDPAMSALVEHRRGMRKAGYLENLALISPGLSLAESQRMPHRMALIDAIRARASELGYQVDFFYLPWNTAKQKEMSRMLKRRNIRGLIFLPSDPPAEEASFGWEDFASIRIYRPPLQPCISSVDTDVYQGIYLMMDRVLAAGCRRPGLVIQKLVSRNTAGIWPRYLNMVVAEHAGLSSVPSFEFDGDITTRGNRTVFMDWIQSCKPDVVLAFSAPNVAKVLQESGYAIPDDIGLVDLDINDVAEESALAGLFQSRTAIGWSAVDQLHGLLLTNTMGLPTYPSTLKMAFRWVDGNSLRRIAPSGKQAV